MTRFDQLGQQIAREQDTLLALPNYPDNQAEVMARLSAQELAPLRAPRRRRALQWSGAAGLSLAAAAALLLVMRGGSHTRPPLAMYVGDSQEPAPAGRWIQAPAAGRTEMRFSDGSRIALAEAARARVVDLNANGADVLLESGLIRVAVRHREQSAWRVNAGPFGVKVTGTRFAVRWRPEEDAFELALEEGNVEVSGCMFGQGYRMKAGQTVRASCRDERFDVSTDGLSAAPQARAAAAAAPPLTASEPSAPPAAPNWQSLARAGRFGEALSAARSAGFATECRRANADELSVLADLARYGRDVAGEKRALQLLRTRHSGSRQASQAAFALGRLEFDRHGAFAEAAGWFRVYLKEQPRGELAREASGRLLEATDRAGRSSAARELAAQYLRDYPSGPHAELARRLAGGGERP
jgi:transmembrane sensor